MTIYLALDVGTTGTKGALINANGDVLRSASCEHKTHTAKGGIVEQNPADWWLAVRDVCTKLDATKEAQAIAITGQMQNLILLTSGGAAVRPAILYSDTRARKQAEIINERAEGNILRRLTGNAQGADSLLAKLLWLHQREPDMLAKAEHLLLGAADVIALQMTGNAVVDTTTASTTGLLVLNMRQAISPEKINLPEIEPYLDLLPQPTAGGTPIGTLTTRAAEQLYLQAGIPVCHGPGDAGAATIGVGSGEPGTAYAYLGASGWVAFSAEAVANPESGVITLAHPRKQNTIQVAPLLTAGGNLDWVRGLFDADYDDLVVKAAACAPTHMIYLPYLNGERSPFVDPHARGVFVGLDSRTDRAAMSRAVLEGIAYAYRHALEALLPQLPAQITLIGGGMRHREWSQLFADVLGLPVFVPADAENIGLYGAVIAAEVQQGNRSDFHIDLRQGKLFHPNDAHTAHYNHLYPTFKATYVALKPIFDALVV